MSLRRVARLAREAALTVGALLGVLCLVAAVLATLADVRPVVFRSGSMEPAISTGALALSRTVDAGELEVGDVVTVRDAEGALVTHRIRGLTRDGDRAELVLKGDASPVADASPYVVESADRILLDVPRLGYVVSALSGRVGTFGGGLLVGLLLTTAFGRRRAAAAKKSGRVPGNGRHRAAEPGPPGGRPALTRRRGLVVAVAVVAVLGPLAGVRATAAAWTDTAEVTTESFASSARPPAPPTLGCTTIDGGIFGLDSARVSLTKPSGSQGLEYGWELRSPGGGLAASGVLGRGQAAGSVLSHTVDSTAFGNDYGTYTFVVQTRLSAATGWTSATSVTRALTRQFLVGFRCA